MKPLINREARKFYLEFDFSETDELLALLLEASAHSSAEDKQAYDDAIKVLLSEFYRVQ